MWPIEWRYYLEGHFCRVHFHWRISTLCLKTSWFCFQ